MTVLLAGLGATAPSAAAASLPEFFWQTPEDGKSGSGAGQLLGSSAIGVDPVGGDLFVADALNARIDEFTPWGEFVKAWGWGVVASGPDNKVPKNAVQEVDVSAMGSSYKLVFQNTFQNGGSIAQQTEPIASSASAATVQAALEDLESLAPGDVLVSGPAGGPYTVEFTGTFADSAVRPLLVRGAVMGEATVLQSGGSFEVCIVKNGDTCQMGQRGGYAGGQFPNLGAGLVVDGAGHLFVDEAAHSEIGVPGGNIQENNMRVQEFDLEGNFLAMWGGNVDKTSGADICTKADLEGGDECGVGVPGSGSGEFQLEGIRFGEGIAVGPGGDVFVGDVGRIQKFTPGGAFLTSVPIGADTVKSLAIDSQGNYYVTFQSEAVGDGGVKPGVRKLGPTGTLISVLGAEEPEILKQIRAVAVGVGDSLYAAGRLFVKSGEVPPSIVRFSAGGSEEIDAEDEFGQSSLISGLATSNACGIDGEDIYATSKSKSGGDVLRAYGPPPNPNLCPPPKAAPTIVDSYATSVHPEGAVVKATINPHFWPDVHFRVEYGTGKCSEGGCELLQPAPPGLKLGERVVNAPVPTQGVLLSSLAPSTTYHYRFVAESSGGGPTVGSERSFTTFPLPQRPSTTCPNAAFRSGAAAGLPDCRAYEIVTPIEKGNADILPLLADPLTHNRAALDQSSADGQKLTYSTYRAFGDAGSAPFSSQYIATRTASGWSSHGISPPRGHLLVETNVTTDTQFKAFSSDLCTGWVLQETDALLAAGAVPGFPDLYRRQNCEPEADSYQPLTTVEPSGVSPKKYLLELQGISADGNHALFEAVTGETGGHQETQLFEAFGSGQVRPVCILPNGTPVSTGCSAGTFSSPFRNGRREAVSHAISADGSRIFWSDAGYFEGQGKIYVRVNGEHTLAVSKEAEALTGREKAQYWGASADGSRAIFTVGTMAAEEDSLRKGAADLYEFDVAGEATALIAHGVYGVLGMSEDAKRIYFLSKEALGGGSVAGKPNLYLRELGSEPVFIATLSTLDAEPGSNTIFSPINFEASKHTAQVTPDGNVAVFMSTASLTGAENTDTVSGQADAEVYRYDATSGHLDCISCSPTGARPTGRNIGNETFPMWTASRLPLIQTELYPISRGISANGKRVFFESFDPLVPTDTNGAQDVYEWEAPGEGDCTEQSPAFSATAQGCVSLISSGEDPTDAEIVDSDPTGENVFFATQESLVSQDPGLIDIYDARVSGGFPPLASPPPGCEGETCQSPGESPGEVAPASSSFEGAGNVTEKPQHHRKKPHRKHKKHRKPHQHRKGAK